MVPGAVVEPPPPGLERNSSMHAWVHPESGCGATGTGDSAGS